MRGVVSSRLLLVLTLALLLAVAFPVANAHGVSLVALLLTLAWTWATVSLPRVRAYGVTTLALPGFAGLLLTNGSLETRALGAALTTLVFLIGSSLGWGLEDEARTPWWPVVALFVWQPSSLGVLGLSGLALISGLRWRAGVSWTRGSQRSGAPRAWLAALMLVTLLAVLSLPLSTPTPLRTPSVPVPRLTISQTPGLNAVPDTPLVFSGAPPESTRFQLPPPWVWMLPLALLVWFVWFVWRQRLVPNTKLISSADSLTSPAQGRQRFMLPLLILFALLLYVGLLAWRTAGAEVIVPVEVLTAGWQVVFALGAFALVWAVWRFVRRFKRLTSKPTDLEPLESVTPTPLELSSDRVRAAYQTWLRLLTEIDLRRGAWQTPLEFARYVNVHHPNLRGSTDALTVAYERVRYGGFPSDAELEAVRAALEVWTVHAARERERNLASSAFHLEPPD
ncbi:MAG: DUF4129 domain-containing protein [Pleurocapsa sp. SU_196_0]|nr:DUF4129 domain-containing protein [Pleurocapsa sp. SU_196_0]